MTKRNKTDLTALFETGDTATGTNFLDLIDSQLNLAQTSAQSVAGPITFDGKVTAVAGLDVVGGSMFLGPTNIQVSAPVNFRQTVSASALWQHTSATAQFSRLNVESSGGVGGPLINVASGGGIFTDNLTVDEVVTASSFHLGGALTFDATMVTSGAQSAPNFAEISGFAEFLKVTLSGKTMAIPLVSASF